MTYERSGRDKGGGRSRGGSSQGRGRGRQSFNKAKNECFKCHKMRHFQYEWPKWEKKVNYVET